MNIIVNILFYILATFLSVKTVFYGIFEIQQKNFFGGVFVIIFSSLVYLLFIIVMIFN